MEVVHTTENGRTRLVGDDGIQLVKGGITQNDNFASAVYKSYTNIVNNPIAMFWVPFYCFLRATAMDHWRLLMTLF